MVATKVFVHIVTWNSARHIERCVENVMQQSGLTLASDLHLHITDNASHDGTWEIVQHLGTQHLGTQGVTTSRNEENIGFCGAHNQGVRLAMQHGCSHLLILNPDVALEPHSLGRLLKAFDRDSSIGFATPKLLRADDSLRPIQPATLDAAGMVLLSSLRHFDRGAGERDQGQYDQESYVFGGTGACLLISLECAWSLAIKRTDAEGSLFDLYPQLRDGAEDRPQLFDESFFAYREDADLAWRGRRLGWRCAYVPDAIGYHVRVVVPERRSSLPSTLNLFSVRNRFLLQINNWSFDCGWRTFVDGIVIRNLVVFFGVILREWSSLPAIPQLFRLLYRGDKIRGQMLQRRSELTAGEGISSGGHRRRCATSLAQLNELA